MERLAVTDVAEILQAITEIICKNSEYLCELDSVVGDGDHGTTIQRGVKAAQEKIAAGEPKTISEYLSMYAMGMMSSMGGASGPIFGSFFMGMGAAATGKDEIDADALIVMVKTGLEKVQAIGKAQEGDKTLIDALIPAIRAAEAVQGGTLTQVLEALAQGAKDGVENTKSLVAQKGRSRYAGERGLGHADAGATSLSLILQAFASHVGATHA